MFWDYRLATGGALPANDLIQFVSLDYFVVTQTALSIAESINDDTAGAIPVNSQIRAAIAASGGGGGGSGVTDNSVYTAAIQSQAVTGEKIAEDAVTADNIAAGAVGSSELDGEAVTTAKIDAKAVVRAKIGDNAVGTGQLGDNSVTGPKIANQAVGLAKLEQSLQEKLNFAGGTPEDAQIAFDIVGGDSGVGAITEGTEPVTAALPEEFDFNDLEGQITLELAASGVVANYFFGDVTLLPETKPSTGNLRLVTGTNTSVVSATSFIWKDDTGIRLEITGSTGIVFRTITVRTKLITWLRKGIAYPAVDLTHPVAIFRDYSADDATITELATFRGLWFISGQQVAGRGIPSALFRDNTADDEAPAAVNNEILLPPGSLVRVFSATDFRLVTIPRTMEQVRALARETRRYTIKAWLRLLGTDTPTSTSLNTAGTWNDTTQSFTTKPGHGTLGDVFDISDLPADAFSSTTHGYWEYERYFTVGETGVAATEWTLTGRINPVTARPAYNEVLAATRTGVASVTLPTNYADYRWLSFMVNVGGDQSHGTIPTSFLALGDTTRLRTQGNIDFSWTLTTRVLDPELSGTVLFAALHD